MRAAEHLCLVKQITTRTVGMQVLGCVNCAEAQKPCVHVFWGANQQAMPFLFWSTYSSPKVLAFHLCVHPAVGVTLNCEKVVKMLTALQRRQQARAGVLGAAGAHAPGTTGLLLEGGGRQPSSQCDVLVCARGGDGRLQVGAAAVAGSGCCSV
jgi:hypothetical protein